MWADGLGASNVLPCDIRPLGASSPSTLSDPPTPTDSDSHEGPIADPSATLHDPDISTPPAISKLNDSSEESCRMCGEIKPCNNPNCVRRNNITTVPSLPPINEHGMLTDVPVAEVSAPNTEPIAVLNNELNT